MPAATRDSLLSALQANVKAAIASGALPRPAKAKPTTVAGPRAGALRIDAGMDNGALYAALVADKQARLQQLFPVGWIENIIQPAAYMSGHDLCLEASWPPALRTQKVLLSEMGQHPQSPGAFIVGNNDSGVTVTLKFDDRVTQNALLAGMSGSGKTTATRSLLAQLARNEPAANFVIIDGKGELRGLDTLRGLVGPLANTPGEALAALTWVQTEMQRRNRAGGVHAPLYFAWDEPAELLLNDAHAAKLLYTVAAQCRSANIHTVVATQSPKQQMFGNPMTRGQFGVGVCFLVRDRYESEVAIGDTEPRADHLTAAGDAYVVAPGVCERVLVAFPDDALIEGVLGHRPALDVWPMEYDPEAADRVCVAPAQAAALLWTAQHGMSRDRLRKAMAATSGAFTNDQYGELKAYAEAMKVAYEGISE